MRLSKIGTKNQTPKNKPVISSSKAQKINVCGIPAPAYSARMGPFTAAFRKRDSG